VNAVTAGRRSQGRAAPGGAPKAAARASAGEDRRLAGNCFIAVRGARIYVLRSQRAGRVEVEMHMNAAKAAGWTLIVFCTGTLTACGYEHHDRRDSGPTRSQTREVEAFDSIDMQGAARLLITVGKPESLVIEGREAAIERVETEVRGNTLHIESKPKDWFMNSSRRRVTLRITVPHLESLQVEGGNDIRLSGFAGGESNIRLAGAAHIKAVGHLDELTVRMAGAGHGDFSRLIADQTKVVVDGVGSVIVHPRQTLDATMNGVGAILYTGNPREVNTRMNGLGTIGRRDPKDAPEEQGDEDDDEDAQVAPDPDALQPEYEKPRRKPAADATEVI
jgi:hypothetical protein